MADNQHSHLTRHGKITQRIEASSAGVPVKRAETLIQQQHWSVPQHRPGQCHTLLLTTRNFIWKARLQPANAQPFKGGIDINAPVLRQIEAERDILLAGQMGEQIVCLKDRGHRPVPWWAGKKGFAFPADRTGLRHLKPRDQIEQGGLADARHPLNSQDMASIQSEMISEFLSAGSTKAKIFDIKHAGAFQSAVRQG